MKNYFFLLNVGLILINPGYCSSATIKMSPENELRIKARNRTLSYFDIEKEKSWNGPFFFIHAADTQYGMIESYIEKKPDGGWDQEIALTAKAILAANRMNPKPRFFVVCGDLVNEMPANSIKEAQIKDFKKSFRDLDSDIPLICVCGNHDIGNTPTPQSIQNFQDQFGDDYFSFVCGGVKFLVLNSQFYEDFSQVPELAKEQDIWLDKELRETVDKGYKYIIVFQHIPWFLRTPTEEKEYFNIDTELRLNMLKKFNDYGVHGIFCGHYHRNAGGFYEKMELVVTSAIGAQMGNDKSGMRIVKMLEDGFKHEYFDLNQVPRDIPLN